MAAMFVCSSDAWSQTRHALSLSFTHYVGNRPLSLDKGTYINKLGQTYSITMLKYYISNIKLRAKDGRVYEDKDGYYIINAADSSSLNVILSNIPIDWYDTLSFVIGVDSLHNCSGAQKGALDPANGMFWAWNTGYIFLKMEGSSPASNSPGHIFEYHIGGYKEPSNCIRKVNLAIRKNKWFNYHSASTLEEKSHVKDKDIPYKFEADEKKDLYQIDVDVDVEKMLSSPAAIDFSKLSSVTDFHNAPAIADRYIGMFQIKKEVVGEK